MTQIRARIQYRGIVGMAYKEFRTRFLVPMWRAMGYYWFRSMAPRHFEAGADRRYGYTARTANYQRRKARSKHHQRPLVWSGELKRLTLGSYRLDAQRAGIKVVLPGARKANFRHPKSRVNMRVELTNVIPAEAQELMGVGNKYMKAALRDVPRSQIKTIQ